MFQPGTSVTSVFLWLLSHVFVTDDLGRSRFCLPHIRCLVVYKLPGTNQSSDQFSERVWVFCSLVLTKVVHDREFLRLCLLMVERFEHFFDLISLVPARALRCSRNIDPQDVCEVSKVSQLKFLSCILNLSSSSLELDIVVMSST